MNLYRADLHIHTVLSPCGSLDMSPARIVERTREQRLDIIAITDHNSTLHGPIVRKIAEPFGIKVLYGAEVTTREEVHCLCLFDKEDQRVSFQQFLEQSITRVPNDIDMFGHQVVVNENEEIQLEVEHYLLAALKAGVEEVEQKAHSLGGLFIPAHVDRACYGLIGQLGFIPPDLKFDALELTPRTAIADFYSKNTTLGKPCILRNSDAHMPDQIGSVVSSFCMEDISLDEMLMCLKGQGNREVLV